MKKQSPDEPLPPHSDEAEKGVLGCILMDPSTLELVAAVGTAPEWFYSLRTRVVYHRMTRLKATGVAIDLITLSTALRDAGELEGAGGLTELATLPDAVPSAANVDYYLDILREKWTQRRALATFIEAVKDVREADGVTAAAAIARVAQEMNSLTDGAMVRRAQHMREIMPAVTDDLEDMWSKYHRGHAQIRGLTMGLSYLDKILCGIGGKHGNLLVLAARPGVGKSALAMQIATHVALDYVWVTPRLGPDGNAQMDTTGEKPVWDEHRGLPVGVFSLEMTGEELLKRMMFMRAGADAQRFRTGFAAKEDFDRLIKVSVELGVAPIYVDEDDSLTIDELGARARMMVRQHNIKLFIVDYIQCLQVSQKRFRQDRVQEMAEISNGLRQLAKQLNVPFLVLAQMNREFAKEKGSRKPRLEDLRDSGAIEQDAHVVLFLYDEDNAAAKRECDEHVEEVYKAKRKDDWTPYRLMKALVAKNRHGMNNKAATLLFDTASTKFVDYYDWLKEHGRKAPAEGEAKPKEDNPI